VDERGGLALTVLVSFQIVVDCKVADKVIDCWNENYRSQSSGGRRMGYMGHLIDIIGAVQSSMSASDEFRALIESSLPTGSVGGEGEPAEDCSWAKILESNDNEMKKQTRLLADCDPVERQEYGRDVLAGFPSNTAEYENDTEDFDYQYNSSMQ
jgi:SIT4 phosphatase-associated protein